VALLKRLKVGFGGLNSGTAWSGNRLRKLRQLEKPGCFTYKKRLRKLYNLMMGHRSALL
jgi:hypothetical protein